jgi:ubiquinone/menaquinone biosynthesis C-methylase UbiE
VEQADLRRDDRVLDLGCGVGRLAFPLARYLSDRGSYEGLDVARASMEWCTAHICASHPNFRFTTADVTTQDNVRGEDPARYRFPYEDGSFDLVYAGSLFSHLLPTAAVNYLAETARVLRSGEGLSLPSSSSIGRRSVCSR